MNSLKSLERVCKDAYYNARILLKFGTGSPEKVSLPDTEQILHVNPHDYRARKIIITNCCVRGRIPRNQRFWRMAVKELNPNTVLDVGLNYGECLLSTSYPSNTKLFAVEANQNLKTYIEKSIAAHPNRDQIKCVFKLATDNIEESEFWTNSRWSGGSTAASPVGTVNESSFKKMTISSTTIDHVISAQYTKQEVLFFKIDVEGYERRVLMGMQQTLSNSSNAVGLIEFDPSMLKRAGEDVEEFWAFLLKSFRVFAFDKQDAWHDCQNLKLADLKYICGKHFHTDLVLVKSDNAEGILQQLRTSWNDSAMVQRAA